MKKIVVLFFILSFISFGCTKKAGQALSDKVRELYKENLKPMPRVNFLNTIGFSPTMDQIELGRLLFNDPIISRNNDVSCATCHLTNHGLADGQRLNFGALGKNGPNGNTVGAQWAQKTLSTSRYCDEDGFGFFCSGPMNRNTLSTVNVAHRANRAKDRGLMWDGRFGKLFHTSLLPIMTLKELCGSNPIPEESQNLFSPGKYYFKEPVNIYFATPEDSYSGKDVDGFYSRSKKVEGVPSVRKNGTRSIPTKNECLAIAVAKIRSVKKYRKLFEKAFSDKKVNDTNLGKALASFISTHVSKNTKYDRFVNGENSLSESELLGLVVFMSEPNSTVELMGRKVTGAGCVHCHKPPLFGSSSEYFSLGVKSDPRSDQSVAKIIFSKESFFNKTNARGFEAQCYLKGISANEKNGYGPDMGAAITTGNQEDCFSFRVPPLRNVIETYPYFHHGVSRAQGQESDSFKDRSRKALKASIDYHLQGPTNISQINLMLGSSSYLDPSYISDPLIPASLQSFSKGDQTQFPIKLNNKEKKWLFDFVAEGLQDKKATRVGELGNDISHPKKVPSGLTPTISRDNGKQNEKIGQP